MSEELAGLLEGRLSELWRTPVDIRDLRGLTGGASRQTWAFEAVPRQREPVRLVLRRDPPGHGDARTMAMEAALLRAAGEQEVPVPRLVDHCGDESVLGAPYVLTEHVDGETIPRKLLREPRFESVRATLAAELGRVLARVHRIPGSAVPDLPDADPLDALVRTYDRLAEPLPTVEVALHWLRANRPPPSGDHVVHGDFRNGNLIVDTDGLRAVLDWELAHLGDPVEDLGWLCVKAWRFGSALPVGGFGTREQLLDGYAEVAGTRPDPNRLRWWEVYGTAKWAVYCRYQAQRHLSGQTRSVELAAVGRRVCEQEHDLLLALGVEPGHPTDAESADPAGLHGRPTATELVEAVGEFLRGEVCAHAEGALRYHARVAANVLDIVRRELTLGAAQERAHALRLADLGVRDRNEFAAALREGALDPFDPAVLAAVRADVADRLAVANPGYAQQSH